MVRHEDLLPTGGRRLLIDSNFSFHNSRSHCMGCEHPRARMTSLFKLKKSGTMSGRISGGKFSLSLHAYRVTRCDKENTTKHQIFWAASRIPTFTLS